MNFRALVLLSWFGVSLAPPTAATASDLLTSANVNLRSGAGTDHVRIATLPRGTLVEVDDCRDGWCRIKAQGQAGWVAARYLVEPRLPDAGAVERFRPSVVAPPPNVKLDLVVPRDYHDLGSSRYHEPLRKLHE